MSAALDTLSKDEMAQFEQMRADDAAFVADTPEPAAPAPEPVEPRDEPEVAARKVPEPDEAAEPKVVDKRALDEERSRRKKAEASAAELQRKYDADLARADERVKMLAQAVDAHTSQTVPKAVEAAPEPLPAFSDDPQTFILRRFEELDRKYAAVQAAAEAAKQSTTQFEQSRQQQAAVADLDAWTAHEEARFAAVTSDYGDAMKHLIAVEKARMQRIGVTDERAITAQIAQNVRGLAHNARQRGVGVGELLYGLAQDSGYRPGAAPAAADAPAATARAAAPVVDASSAAERLLRGADMATTLGSTGGAPRGETAPTAIASMSDAEFTKLLAETEKRGPAAMRGLFGE
jgi:hypothetical protein